MIENATIQDPFIRVEPSSLVHTSETVPEKHPCPKVGDRVVWNRADPSQWFYAGCDAFTCSVCGPVKVSRTAKAVAHTTAQHKRSRFGTLTLAPPEWQARRQKVRKLALALRKEHLATEWAWTTEKGSKTGMVHVHFIQHGDFIPQALLQDLWGARVDIRAVKDAPETVAGYVAKGGTAVARYLSKGTGDQYGEWLALNGGRPFHFSRGFFPAGGVRGATQAAGAAQRAATGVQWAVGRSSVLLVAQGLLTSSDEVHEPFAPTVWVPSA